MNNSVNTIDKNTPVFVAFLSGAQKILSGYMQANFQRLCEIETQRLEVLEGPKYLHIVKSRYEKGKEDGKAHASSSWCLVDRENGDVLKAAGYGRPAKGARGNIFDETGGLGRIGPYGPAYNNGYSSIK